MNIIQGSTSLASEQAITYQAQGDEMSNKRLVILGIWAIVILSAIFYLRRNPPHKEAINTTPVATMLVLVPVPTAVVMEPAPTATPTLNVCGETEVVPAGEFERPYNTGNSALANNFVRSVTIGRVGAWIGYGDGAGISYFDGVNWRFCLETPHVNAIALDQQGNPWVGTDAPPGGPALLHFDGKTWIDFTSSLPDYRVYDLAWNQGSLYVGTWEGVAQFDGQDWTVPYNDNAQKNIFQSNIHAIAFVPNGDIWFGSVDKGVTWYHQGSPTLVTSPEYNGAGALLELGGDNIREITVSPSGDQVWIAADGGNVTVYDYTTNTWARLPTPNIHVTDLEFDPLGRPWIATAGGTFYYENDTWMPMPYDYPALSLAFGCDECVFDQDDMFIGTNGFGLIHATVPAELTISTPGDSP